MSDIDEGTVEMASADKRKPVAKASKSNAKRAPLDLGTDDVHQPATVGGLKTKRKGLSMRLGFPSGHQLEIMHAGAELADVLCRGNTPLDAAAAGDAAKSDPVWVQVAKCGHFEGHPAGPFDLNPKIFADIVRNFESVDGKKVFFDFEHASEEDPANGNIAVNGAPAQGRILELDNRGTEGLWGLVQWFDPAREYIRAGKYTSLSPAIRFNARHPITGQPIGARLTSVALTNRPFLRGLAPLAAKDASRMPLVDAGAEMPGLRACLQLSSLASPLECRDAMKRLRALYDMADHAHQTVTGVNLSGYTQAMMALTGTPADGMLDDLLDAVDAKIAAAIAQHNLERHDGVNADDDDDTAGMADTNTETTAMSDTTAQPTTNMNDSRIKDLEAKNAELALKLGAAEAKNETLASDVKALKEAHEKRLATDRDSRVAEAFETYKDSHKLTDASRDMMRVYLETKPEEFDKLYPRVSPRERYLLRDVAPPPPPASPNGGAPIVATPGSTEPLPTVELLVPALMKEGHSLADACIMAEERVQSARAARRAA
jgi:hypothetical protein